MINKLFHTIEDESFIFEGESMTIVPIPSEYKDNIVVNSTDCEELEKEIQSDVQSAIEEVPEGYKIKVIEPKDRKITSIILPITKVCNLACPYCFAKSNTERNNEEDFSENDINDLLDYMRENVSKDTPLCVIFFGGEPLIRFDLIKTIIGRIKEESYNKYVSYSITTNGTLLTDTIACYLKENNFAVLLSVDGFDNEFNHRVFKNGKPAFTRAMKGLETLRRNNVECEIRATLTQDNPYLEETHHFFETLAIPYNIAFAYTSANTEGNKYSNFENEELAAIVDAYTKLENYYVEKIKNGEPIYNKLVTSISERIEYRMHQNQVCRGGFTHYTLTHGGNLFSCPHLMNNEELIMCNIKDFSKLYEKEFEYTPVDIDLIEGCSKCWAKHLCLGGCPTEKYLAGRNNRMPFEEKRCLLEKIMMTFYLKIYYHIKTKVRARNNK